MVIPLDLPPDGQIRRLLDLAAEILPAFGLAQGNAPAHEIARELDRLDDSELLGGTIVDPAQAACVRSGLLLRADLFERSHDISQSIETPEGSYWHGILHRREPDDSNARYWFHRVGAHEILRPLLQRAERELGADLPAGIEEAGNWSLFGFVELCSRERTRATPQGDLLLTLQRLEIECLLGYCATRALRAR